MLVMVVFFIAFRWIHLSTPLIRLFLLVLILLLMPTLNFLPVWFALSLLRFRLPSRLPMMFISSVDKQASHFVHIPGLSYSGVKSPTECQQSLFESHFASRQSLSDCPVAF